MSIIYCPQCKSVLPDTAHFCAMCGKSIPPAGNQPFSDRDQEETLTSWQSRAQDRRATLTTPLFYDHHTFNKAGNMAENGPASHLTWHKVVEHQRPRLPVMYPPRPARPSWLMSLYGRTLRHPRLFFWISLLAVVTLLLGGVFGILTSLGRVRNSGDNAISLQVTPGSAVVGATITLHGTHFTPRGRIGISRDASIPITDTGDRVTFDADANGNFTDTVIVGEDWGNGPHNINAEDAHTHTIASFSILVLGQNPALRPAHLNISQNTLDLGSGDPALNSARVITLTNSGGGQLSWQSQSSQPWLQLTPQRGQATHGISSQVTIAANRIDMHPGVYKGQLLFTSEAGDVPLDVQMQVTPLDPANSAMLQLSPAVLSFTGSDGEASLAPQEMKVSNPGVLPLNWTATTDVPWLSVAEKSGMIQPGSSAQVGVFVNIASLLPGTYRGTITFNGQGNAVKDSPQNVYVSVTIEPRCALQLSPNILTFSGAFQQGEPAAKKISITGTRECSAPLNWNASSNASWLTLST
ncbi:MAG: zinc ribbon domain-containing protein, partial [Ktedonobacteraceae bacterium]|nr:zinc ribbon domain-containing protein [Ktedonobacteraceae bacterium]